MFTALGGQGTLQINSESEKIVKNLSTQISLYEGVRKNAQKVISATNSSARASRSNASAKNEEAEAIQNVKKALEEEVNTYKTVISYIKKKISEQINSIKDLEKQTTDAIKKQIDALEEQKDKEKSYYDDKIKALQEQNDALNDQIEYQKLLEALEKAKQTKVRVYREGQGFVYETDQSAVNEARRNIEEYNLKKKQEKEIKDLEDLRDAKEKLYEQQINDLEKYQEKVKEDYDNQIKYYEEWEKQFEKQVDSYETEQNRLKALELTGIDFEQQGWQTRLGNLANFVNQYSAKLSELARITEEYNRIQANTSSPSGGGGGGYSPTDSKKATQYKIVGHDSRGYSLNADYIQSLMNDARPLGITDLRLFDNLPKTNSGMTKENAEKWIKILSSNYGNKYFSIDTYAKGVSSVSKDQVAIVGENPNKEIVLGSKANGVMTTIDKGGGVVNAKSTRTLAGLLNQLGSMGIGGNTYPTTNNTQSNTITIGNISLPQVKNGADFVDYLQNFSLDMKQKAFI